MPNQTNQLFFMKLKNFINVMNYHLSNLLFLFLYVYTFVYIYIYKYIYIYIYICTYMSDWKMSGIHM